MKVAATVRAAVMLTAQLPVPAQLTPLPLQPEKVYPLPAAAVRVTDVPLAYDALQALPQLIPDGLEVTVPEPDTAMDRV